MEPGAKAAGEGPEGEGLVPDHSQRLLLKEEPHISVVFFNKSLQDVRFIISQNPRCLRPPFSGVPEVWARTVGKQ